MKTLRILIRLDAVLLAFFGYLMTTYTHTVTMTGPAGLGVRHFEQEQAPLIFLGTTVMVLAVVLFVVSDFALIGHRRKLGTLLAAGNLVIAVAIVAPQPSEWGGFMGWIPALVLLIMAVALAWTSWRPLKPDNTAAELAALQIPDDIRQALLRQIGETAAQEERNRLARDLHDSIKQQIFTINVSTAAAQELWERDPEKARGALADVRRSAREAMVEMQALLHQLTPRALTSAGLIEALREQCEALGYRTGAEVTLELGEAIPDDQLPPGAQETLFRIAQEALANVARHARARNVRVWLGEASGAAWLRIEDNGQGFQPAQVSSGMGLRNLNDRAESLRGNLAVTSSPGAGTRVEVRIPLGPPVSESPLQKAIKTQHDAFSLLSTPAVFFLFAVAQEPLSYIYPITSTFLLLSLLVWSWWSAPRVIRRSPGASPESLSLLWFYLHRHRALNLLLLMWWTPWYRNLEEGWTRERHAWLAVALVCFLLAVREILSVHQVSQFMIFRQAISSVWFRVSFFLALGVVLIGLFGVLSMIAVTALFDPKNLEILIGSLEKTFHPIPIKIAFLGTVTPVFLYLVFRQPRTEGAPA